MSDPLTDRNVHLRVPQYVLRECILVLDGSMDTMIQNYRLEKANYHGERFAG